MRSLPQDTARSGEMMIEAAGQLHETLALVAPGTVLRDGLERILRGRTGAIIISS